MAIGRKPEIRERPSIDLVELIWRAEDGRLMVMDFFRSEASCRRAAGPGTATGTDPLAKYR